MLGARMWQQHRMSGLLDDCLKTGRGGAMSEAVWHVTSLHASAAEFLLRHGMRGLPLNYTW